MSRQVPRVYLDVCCLNRPFDDQSQPRIRVETEAVIIILAQIDLGEVEWVSAEPIEQEISHTLEPDRRNRVAEILTRASHRIDIDDAVAMRARDLEARGFRAFDALHLACAERAGAAVFLTTDDRLLSRARRVAKQLRVRALNPVDWLREWQPE